MLRRVELVAIAQHCSFSIARCFGLHSTEVFGAKPAEELRDYSTECGAFSGGD